MSRLEILKTAFLAGLICLALLLDARHGGARQLPLADLQVPMSQPQG